MRQKRHARRLVEALCYTAMLSFCLAPVAAQAKDVQAYVQSAEGYIAKGNLPAAEIELRNAVRQAPNDGRARALLARVYLGLGQFRQAEREASAAGDLKAAEAEYLPIYAEALLRQGKFADLAQRVTPSERAPELESKLRMALAMAAANLRDPKKAERLLREAIALDPTSSAAKLALVRFLLRSNVDEAEKILDGVVAVDRGSAEALALKGEILALRGNADDAMQRFAEALVIDPNNATARLSRASLNLSRGELTSVEADVAPILKSSPQNFRANYLRAVALFKKGDFAGADPILDRLSANFSNMPEGYYVQAATKFSLKQYSQADAAITKYIDRIPQNSPAVRLAAMIAIARSSPEIAVSRLTEYLKKATPDAATLTLLGDAYTMMGKRSLALEQYKEAAELNPESLPLKTKVAVSEFNAGARAEGIEELEKTFANNKRVVGPTLGIMYLGAGRGDKAAEVAEDLIKTYGDNPQYQNLLGMARVAQKDFSGAESIFQKMRQNDPDSVVAARNLASVYVATGKKDEAKKVYNGLLERKPTEVAALLGLTDIAAAEKQWDDAFTYANRARAAAPSQITPGLKLLGVYAARQEWARATALASELTNQFPSSAGVLHAAGNILMMSGDRDGAIDAYRRVLARQSEDAVAMNNLAGLYQQKGDLAQARDLAERAAAIAPSNAAIADTLGWVLLAQGDIQRALKYLQAASAAGPGNPEIKYHLAVALHRSGQTADARSVLEKLLSSGVSFTGKADAEKLLGELQRG